MNLFHSKSFYVLRGNHLPSNVFMIFFNVVFLTTIFFISIILCFIFREHGPQEQDHLGLLLGLSLPTWNVLENQLGLLPDSSVKLNFQVKYITLIFIYRGWE